MTLEFLISEGTGDGPSMVGISEAAVGSWDPALLVTRATMELQVQTQTRGEEKWECHWKSLCFTDFTSVSFFFSPLLGLF